MRENRIGLIAGKSGASLVEKLHEKRYVVVMIAGRETDPGVGEADFELITDMSNHSKIISFFKKHDISKVIIGTGHRVVLNLAKEMEKAGIAVSIDIEVSLFVKNKINFKDALVKQGITTPSYKRISWEEVDVEQLRMLYEGPCVIKSATDALPPRKVNSKEEFIEVVRAVEVTKTDVLIEQFIDGGDCTVPIAYDGKNLTNYGVLAWSKAKENHLKGFDTPYAADLDDKMKRIVMEIADDVIKKNNIIGLSRVDFIVKDEEAYVLEANSIIVTARHGTVYPYFKSAGIDIADVMIENALRIFDNIK